MARQRVERSAHVNRDDRNSHLKREHRGTGAKRLHRAVPRDASLGKDPDQSASPDHFDDVAERADHPGVSSDGDGSKQSQERVKSRVLVELSRDQEPDRPSRPQADENGIEERRMIGRENRRPFPRNVILAERLEAKRQREHRPEDRAQREER